jgi:hypothetical protein
LHRDVALQIFVFVHAFHQHAGRGTLGSSWAVRRGTPGLSWTVRGRFVKMRTVIPFYEL